MNWRELAKAIISLVGMVSGILLTLLAVGIITDYF